ncbi:hypothetical protein Bbelb_353180 [Branchiostoma belcheri]|nr:hypothetical protein Bbelb_353180 [Branchiostoma belcheri]
MVRSEPAVVRLGRLVFVEFGYGSAAPSLVSSLIVVGAVRARGRKSSGPPASHRSAWLVGGRLVFGRSAVFGACSWVKFRPTITRSESAVVQLGRLAFGEIGYGSAARPYYNQPPEKVAFRLQNAVSKFPPARTLHKRLGEARTWSDDTCVTANTVMVL